MLVTGTKPSPIMSLLTTSEPSMRFRYNTKLSSYSPGYTVRPIARPRAFCKGAMFWFLGITINNHQKKNFFTVKQGTNIVFSRGSEDGWWTVDFLSDSSVEKFVSDSYHSGSKGSSIFGAAFFLLFEGNSAFSDDSKVEVEFTREVEVG